MGDSVNFELSELSILVVDDDVISRKIEEKFAASVFKRVIAAEDGEQGLIQYQAYFEEFGSYPDVVVVDLEMPNLNGFELIEQLQQRTQDPYIMVATSHQDQQTLLRLINMGVQKVLFKPFDVPNFLQALENAYIYLQNQRLEESQLKFIQKSESRLHQAIEGKGQGLWDWNLETNEVYFSKAWKEMLGFKEHEIQETLDEWEKRVHPDDIELVLQDIHAHLEGQTETYVNEHRMLCKDGSYKWILDEGVITRRNSDGKPTQMVGTHSDISQRKHYELALQAQKDELETIFHTNIDGMAILDLQTRFLRTNSSYQQLVGYNEQELQELTCFELTMPEDRGRVSELVEKVIAKGEIENHEKRCVVKDGRVIDVNVSMSLMPDKQRILISARDVTELKRRQDVIDEYLSILDKNIISFVVGPRGLIKDASVCLINKVGVEHAKLIGMHFEQLIECSEPSLSLEDVQFCITHNQAWSGELKLKSQLGQELWVSCSAQIRSINPGQSGLSFICEDISARKQVEQLSITDAMTQLYNRRHFETVFDIYASLSRRSEEVYTFMMLDVDNFKRYNDCYGHQKGDEVLVRIAEVLKQTLQREDDYCFRLGGEEFAAFYKTKTLKDAMNNAQSVRKTIERLNIEHAHNIPYGCVTVSIGLAFFNQSETGRDLDDLYNDADKLLYQAKNHGRNTVCFEKMEMAQDKKVPKNH